MEVLPGLVLMLVVVAWLWRREHDKRVAAADPPAERADAPSPRDPLGPEDGFVLTWAQTTGSPAGRGLLLGDPETGHEMSAEATLEVDRTEVFDLAEARGEMLQTDDAAPGRPLRLQRESEGSHLEIRTWDGQDLLGWLSQQASERLAAMMDAGRRLEALALWEWRTGAERTGLRVLVTDRGAMPPVPEPPDRPEPVSQEPA